MSRWQLLALIGFAPSLLVALLMIADARFYKYVTDLAWAVLVAGEMEDEE